MKACIEYVIIILSSPKQHISHVPAVWERTCKEGVKLKLQKCSFAVKKSQILCHVAVAEGIKTEGINTTRNCERADTPIKERAFLLPDVLLHLQGALE